MKKLRKYLFILLTSLVINSEIIDNTESRIKEIFPRLLSMQRSLYNISEENIKEIQNKTKQSFFRKEVNIWTILDTDRNKYYAILDNVKGKSMPITFLTIFNENKTIKNISIIKYREPYGGEVRNKSWLKQFASYSDTSNYLIGKEISAISGATISVNSVSKGIRKLSMLIHEIIEDISEN